jgi:hypothetical protein
MAGMGAIVLYKDYNNACVELVTHCYSNYEPPSVMHSAHAPKELAADLKKAHTSVLGLPVSGLD